MDLIRADAAYVRIAASHRATRTTPTLTELLAELRRCLPDMPVGLRIIATAPGRHGARSPAVTAHCSAMQPVAAQPVAPRGQ
jgi:hypothetical protein